MNETAKTKDFGVELGNSPEWPNHKISIYGADKGHSANSEAMKIYNSRFNADITLSRFKEGEECELEKEFWEKEVIEDLFAATNHFLKAYGLSPLPFEQSSVHIVSNNMMKKIMRPLCPYQARLYRNDWYTFRHMVYILRQGGKEVWNDKVLSVMLIEALAAMIAYTNIEIFADGRYFVVEGWSETSPKKSSYTLVQEAIQELITQMILNRYALLHANYAQNAYYFTDGGLAAAFLIFLIHRKESENAEGRSLLFSQLVKSYITGDQSWFQVLEIDEDERALIENLEVSDKDLRVKLETRWDEFYIFTKCWKHYIPDPPKTF